MPHDRRLLALLLVSLAALLAPISSTLAQPFAQATPPRLLSDEAAVSILTIYPGDEVHALFGHTAVRVRDPQRDLDLVYNYGVFHFDSPMFVAEFIRGRLDYILGVDHFDRVMAQYEFERRAVVEQVLDLTPAERDAVFRFLDYNARPENREYRYRFLDDNCSTRVRDVFEHVLGDRLQFKAPEAPAGLTYREALQPYLAVDRLLQLGVDLVMGPPADRRMTRRDAMFLPLPLMEAFAQATVQRGGEPSALVTDTNDLHWLEDADVLHAGWPWPSLLLWILVAVAAVCTLRDVTRAQTRVALRTRPAVADALLLTLAGLAGVVLLGMWTLTEHDVTRSNWHVIWAWPTHLAAAVWLLARPASKGLHIYLAAGAFAAAVAAVTWPLWPQALPWPVLPFVLLLMLRLSLLSYRLSRLAAQPVEAESGDQGASRAVRS